MRLKQCYQKSREENWIQDDEIFRKLIEKSCEYLEDKQKVFVDKYKVNEHDRWGWYKDTGTLVFTHEGQPQVEAEIHFSGSY